MRHETSAFARRSARSLRARASPHNDEAMHMVRHHHMPRQFDVREMGRYALPTRVCDFAVSAESNVVADHFAEDASLVTGANREEVGGGLRIVKTLQANRATNRELGILSHAAEHCNAIVAALLNEYWLQGLSSRQRGMPLLEGYLGAGGLFFGAGAGAGAAGGTGADDGSGPCCCFSDGGGASVNLPSTMGLRSSPSQSS